MTDDEAARDGYGEEDVTSSRPGAPFVWAGAGLMVGLCGGLAWLAGRLTSVAPPAWVGVLVGLAYAVCAVWRFYRAPSEGIPD